MRILNGYEGCKEALVDLFTATFAASEGEDEGHLIGALARDLLMQTPADAIRVFRAVDDDDIIGAGIFTRLFFPGDAMSACLLSPLAVAPDHQRQGIGQSLIEHGLQSLRSEGVQLVMTYGDPDYYGRVGFRPVSAQQVPPPLPLSQPHGWIGQTLSDEALPQLHGPSSCVAALNRADIW